MTIFGAVKERTFELIEQGEYVFTLNDVEYQAEGQFGEALIWKWLVAPVSDPTAYICLANGNEKTIHQYTDVDIILGSKQHEWAQLLSGRMLDKDDAPPEEEELLGRRMLAYLNHYTPKRGKNAGKKREQILEGSAKKFNGPQPNKVFYAQPAARPEPTAAETERAEAVARVEALIGRAVKLETPNHAKYVALNLNEGDVESLQMLANTIREEVQAALDS